MRTGLLCVLCSTLFQVTCTFRCLSSFYNSVSCRKWRGIHMIPVHRSTETTGCYLVGCSACCSGDSDQFAYICEAILAYI